MDDDIEHMDRRLSDAPVAAEALDDDDALLLSSAHAPLLPLIGADATLTHAKTALRARPQRAQSKKIAALVVFVVVALATHILFVVLLRKTTFTLEQLTIPDLCHTQSKGAVVLQFQNPSYCSPDVGPLRLQLSKHSTAFLELALPRFTLASGTSMLVADAEFNLLVPPDVLHALVFGDGRGFEVAGSVPIRIYCMLVPFTVHMNLNNVVLQSPPLPPALTSTDTQPHVAVPPPVLAFTIDPTPDQVLQHAQLAVVNSVRDELERLVEQILRTIALSHVRVETDAEQIFAYTDVSFAYESRVLWNVPSLAIQVRSAARDRILRAGFKRFLLGDGKTFLSAFTAIVKRETAPLQEMLQQYLGGTDVVLHVAGANPKTSCYSLQVLDLMDVKVQVPAKIDGKPAFLRHSAVRPTLKQLDSITHKCLLELDVLITINNPLPIRFDLFAISFDLLYKQSAHGNDRESQNATFLLHVDDRNHTAWFAHHENNLTLVTEVHDFDACSGVIGLYFQDRLAFEIQHGRIALGAGSGNLTIPFSVKEIHIHPSAGSSIARVGREEDRRRGKHKQINGYNVG